MVTAQYFEYRTVAFHRLRVEPDYDGARLDSFLATLLPDQSRSSIQRLIKDGRVTGAHVSLRASPVVKPGQPYEVDVPAPVAATPMAEELPLRIVYEDRDVVVLDK